MQAIISATWIIYALCQRNIKLIVSQKPLIKTSAKKIYFLSASSRNIFLLCQGNVKGVSKKIRLLKKKKNDREKSYCGLEMQRPLNTNLAIGKEFQAICRNWYKSFQTSKQIFRKKTKQLAKSRVQHKKKNVVPMHKKSTLKLKLR